MNDGTTFSQTRDNVEKIGFYVDAIGNKMKHENRRVRHPTAEVVKKKHENEFRNIKKYFLKVHKYAVGTNICITIISNFFECTPSTNFCLGIIERDRYTLYGSHTITKTVHLILKLMWEKAALSLRAASSCQLLRQIKM